MHQLCIKKVRLRGVAHVRRRHPGFKAGEIYSG